MAKVLCHNIVVLIHSFYELGIDPDFAVPTAPPGLPREIIYLPDYQARPV